jgi:serine protease AprX
MNIMKIVRLAFSIYVILILPACVRSQTNYWVFFTDKKGVEFDPYRYFDIRAIDRRNELKLDLNDTTDMPVRNDYIKYVENITGKIKSVSRWFNAVSVCATRDEIDAVNKLDFVKSTMPVSLTAKTAAYSHDFVLSGPKTDLLIKQTERMGGKLFEKNGIDGSGVRIAVFDGGFPGVDRNPVFEHLRVNGRIIKTYDFVRKRENVYSGDTHGAMVLSCIAGQYNGIGIGLATGAEFLLARTERQTEPFSEEENWLAAVEWADRNGADIINSSLGYTYHRYFPTDMDGKTSLVARAANMAASKGILVINAMGNDGSKKWEYLGTPADADSVMSVGGIDPDTDYHIFFSSLGPTSDKRRKPNVSAYGKVIAAKKRKLARLEGTSFSTPLVTGFAACVRQLKPELPNMELLREIEKSAHLYPYYDYAHGYGIPQSAYFLENTPRDTMQTVRFEISNNILSVKVNDLIDLKKEGESNLLFYHIENHDKVLDKYAVIEVFQHDVIEFPVADYRNNELLRVHFRGYTAEYKF